MRGHDTRLLERKRREPHDAERHVCGGAQRSLNRCLAGRLLVGGRFRTLVRSDDLIVGRRIGVDRVGQLLPDAGQRVRGGGLVYVSTFSVKGHL